jgi:nucleoside-diphosphate kinase
MSSNRTLTIIKPDAFAGNKAGLILAHLEKDGFKLIASRVMKLTHEQAGEFYVVHKGRPFYQELVEFMTSGYCMPMVLERDNAVLALLHASDSDENAHREARFFFAETDLIR